MAGKSCARLLVIAGFTRIHAAIDKRRRTRDRRVPALVLTTKGRRIARMVEGS